VLCIHKCKSGDLGNPEMSFLCAMSQKSVLFVCLGNICRSPVAEAIFKHQVKMRGINHLFTADSCGTSNYHIGDDPDPRALCNALKNGVPVSHKGRQLSVNDLKVFDFILAMDQSNYDTILRLPDAEVYQSKIKLVRNYDPSGAGDVPDPYYGNEHDFQLVFEMLNRTLANFLTTESGQ
jgi:protein-tyrosine phosphatase